MVNIEIDGKKLQVEPGSMIIEAADAAGIYIPRFCYHKKLSVAANCRMCLVDVTKAPKAVPACATPVNEGMIVQTKSPKALDAQKAVMEFLLINHPLDCPICDQGGECELQDLAVGYGRDISRYTEGKRVVEDKDIGPLIATEMTRCIHCTRCVRFGTEIAGIRELGATGRGEHMSIGTFIEKSVDSEVSGNVIDLCPVGALTAKPSRFTARAWELQSRPSVAPHDCLGSNVDVHVRRSDVIRVVPRENEAINEVWLSDRDRYSYEALIKSPRLTSPRIRRDGQWHDVSWQEALELTSANLKQLAGADLGALASPSATTEELYLLQKLLRGLNSNNIDVRLRQRDFSTDAHAPLFPALGVPVANLETLDATLLVGSNLRREQPIAALRLRKSTRSGVVMSVADADYDWNFKLAEDIVAPDLLASLAGIAKALSVRKVELLPAGAQALLANVVVSEAHSRVAAQLLRDGNKAVLLGAAALEHEYAASVQALAELIGLLSGASVGVFSHGANSAGAWLAGALPHRREAGQAVSAGRNAVEMLKNGLKAYVLLDVEPEHDSIVGKAANESLKNAQFVVALTPFADSAASQYADVLLPMGAFTETSGTFVNANGVFQTFAAAVPAKGEARPAWKILRVLGNLLNLKGFDYNSSEEVLAELKAVMARTAAPAVSWHAPSKLSGGSAGQPLGLYQVDGTVRRAASLQQTAAGRAPAAQPARVEA
ncbi:NADH-quinone oxidoreductase subunit G [Permianibacter sp. IMCC34836]|uniref:NADH-quinone oxidoreductase subunit NuoG n=1 Tax=Permianibacter fluminis TaxID=2738515 RepID=UPI001555F247|nr:NADH-quinone oxidoreductase subunit NuoG [Permianibacter fluminis]NQD36513.1 NADH-quinone oxidoreductase subunit G [Permianibacter fluminis]